METLMFDMDDVIVSGGFLYLINQYLGTDYKEEDFKDYYMQDVIPDKNDFFKFFLTKNMYDYCDINEGAYEVLKWSNENFRMCIGTSYIFKEIERESGIILLHKYNFLLDKFPFLRAKNFAFVVDKSFLDCNIKVDDRLDNLGDASLKILFSAYHNKGINDEQLKESGIYRADGFGDVKKLLKKRLVLR